MFRSRVTPFVFCLLLFFLTCPAAAQIEDCVDYSDYLRWVYCSPPRVTVGITVVGDLAYISGAGDGLLIYDISQPDRPVLLGECDTPGSCLGNIVVGDLAYIADAWSPGFCVIDVADPTNPQLLGTAGQDAGYCYDLAMVAPDTIYVGDMSGGSMIIDVSDPLDPNYIGSQFLYSTIYEFHKYGDNVYFGDDYGLQVFDVSMGANAPELIGTGDLPGFNYGVTRAGDLMYLVGYESIGTFDISDPLADPVLLDVCELSGPCFRMQTSGTRGFTAVGGTVGHTGMVVFDLSVPEHPDSLGSLTTRWGLDDVALAGDHAFLTSNSMGLGVADISNPINAPAAGYVPLPEARQVVVAGHYAYVAANMYGLYVVDVDDPAGPAMVGHYDPPTYPTMVKVQGGWAYLGVGSAGLEIVDLSDPINPVYAGRADPYGTVHSLEVKGGWAYLGAYVSSSNYDLQIIDVSDPSAPLERNSLDMPDLPLGLAAAGDYLYVATNQQGLQVVDISDPLTATIVGSLDLGGDLSSILVKDDLAVICVDDDGVNFYNGVHFVDITERTNPQLISTLYTPGVSQEVAIAGHLLYIADRAAGLQVADISDLGDPRLIGCLETGRHTALSVALADNCVCVSDWVGGFYTAWPQCGSGSPATDPPPMTAATLSAHPNPFNPRTTLSFTLPEPGRVDLAVYDLGGRLVRTLLADFQVEGTTGSAVWDGCDEAGRPVPAAVYLGQLTLQKGQVEAWRTTVKLTVIK